MITQACRHKESKKHGKDRKGNQRFRCKSCGATWIQETVKPIGEMRISLDKAEFALSLLLEGMSVRATERLTGLHRDTICDLILVVGENCQNLLESKVKQVAVEDVQIDELWSFVGCKEKHRACKGYGTDMGDSWTFIAIERNTKLVLAHQVGARDNDTTNQFLGKLRKAVTGRFQLTSDGFNSYTYNVPFTFRNDVDYGRLIKNYSSSQETTRYSPAQIISAEKKAQFGNPNPDRISTSHIERLNLTLRMNLRRFTRLTNAHSKSLDHHTAMQAICFAWYNFSRKHSTIKMTPAMASGLTDHQWSIRELLEHAASTA